MPFVLAEGAAHETVAVPVTGPVAAGVTLTVVLRDAEPPVPVQDKV